MPNRGAMTITRQAPPLKKAFTPSFLYVFLQRYCTRCQYRTLCTQYVMRNHVKVLTQNNQWFRWNWPLPGPCVTSAAAFSQLKWNSSRHFTFSQAKWKAQDVQYTQTLVAAYHQKVSRWGSSDCRQPDLTWGSHKTQRLHYPSYACPVTHATLVWRTTRVYYVIHVNCVQDPVCAPRTSLLKLAKRGK